MLVNVRTGEVLDFEQATDEEIVAHLQELEELYEQAKAARDTAKMVLLDRMERDGAKLRLTSLAKLRLQKTSRIADRRLVEKIFEDCPEQMRERCFKHDLRPLKSGLNELAKLGADWQKKVDSIYQESSSLKIEWLATDQSEDESVNYEPKLEDVPF